jgi:hypothetical protein
MLSAQAVSRILNIPFNCLNNRASRVPISDLFPERSGVYTLRLVKRRRFKQAI